MPDFKFEVITEKGPWELHELGIAKKGEEGNFYTLSTGHAPNAIDIDRRRLLFRTEITVNGSGIESAQDYLDLLRLRNIELESNHHEDPMAVNDVQMAEYLNRPAVWTESDGNAVDITIDGEDVTVPDRFIIYEMISFDNPIHTMTGLKEKLSEITGQSDIWITIT